MGWDEANRLEVIVNPAPATSYTTTALAYLVLAAKVALAGGQRLQLWVACYT